MTTPGDPRPPDDSLEPYALREAAFSGVRWVAGSRFVAEIVAFSSAVVLAHLVSPASFGRAAVALILVVFATALTGQSLGTPLVQRKILDPGHVRSALTLSLALGGALSAATYAAAPATEGIFGAEVVHLAQLMSPVFALSALGIVPHALLQRALAFRRIASAEVGSVVARSLVSVLLATAGLGAEAIVLGALAGSGVFAIVLFAAAPKTMPGWSRPRAAEVLSFGAPAAGVGVLSQMNRNLDYVILGAQVPSADVGQYWRGYQLGVEYERKLTTIMSRMALPLFSRARTFEDMRRMRMKMTRLNAIAVFGVLALFIAVAPTLVPAVFGSAWEPSILPAQLLALAGMAAATSSGAAPLVLAAGRPRVLLAMSGAFFFVYRAAIWLAASHGLAAVCIAATAAHLVRTAALHWLVLDRIIGIPLSDLRRDLVPATAASLVAGSVAAAAHAGLSSAALPAALVVGGAVAPAALVYIAVLKVCFVDAWHDVRTMLTRVLSRRGRGPVSGLGPAASPART